MKKSFFKNILLISATSGGFFLSFGIANAQSAPSIGTIFTSNAQECSMACSNDILCAAWSFAPMKIGNTSATTGQCQFSNTQNISVPANGVGGRPQRNPNFAANYVTGAYNNGAQIAPISNAPAQNTPNMYQGNYSIRPLGGVQKNVQQMASNPQTQTPQAQMPQPNAANNAMVSFAPRPNTAPVEIARTPQNHQPISSAQSTAIAPHATQHANTQPQFPQPNAPQMQGQLQPRTSNPPSVKPNAIVENKAPLGHANTNSAKPLNMSQFIGPDGMVDAAEMRRAQLKQAVKTGGQYSVQREWSEVAQAMENGTNTSNIDWSKTTPIKTDEDYRAEVEMAEKAKEASKTDENNIAKPKKQLFGFLKPKQVEEGIYQPLQQSAGPLRRRPRDSSEVVTNQQPQ